MSHALSQHKPVALVGVDGADHSDPAVVAAFRLAPALKLSVELVHAADVGHDFWSHVDPLGVQRARDASAQRLAQVLIAAGIVGADLTRSLSIVGGKPASALLERADERNAALIVLGPHRRRAPLDFGDVAREVIAHAHCPVWVQHGAPQPIKRVVCALDLGQNAVEVLTLARDVARALGAEVLALHCFVRPELGFLLGYPVQFPASVVDGARESAEREFRRLLEPFDWRGVLHRHSFIEGDPESELVEAQAQCDLLVLGTHGRSGVVRALLGSVAAGVLRRATVPVLVTRTGA